MRYIFQLSQYYGWESAKYGHGSVLSDLKDGKYSWLDIQRMLDACRHATQLHQRRDLLPPVEAPSPAPTRQGKLSRKQKTRFKFQGKNKTELVCILIMTNAGLNPIMRVRKFSGDMFATVVGRRDIQTITVLF
jgi:hypothetical protein